MTATDPISRTRRPFHTSSPFPEAGGNEQSLEDLVENLLLDRALREGRPQGDLQGLTRLDADDPHRPGRIDAFRGRDRDPSLAQRCYDPGDGADHCSPIIARARKPTLQPLSPFGCPRPPHLPRLPDEWREPRFLEGSRAQER